MSNIYERPETIAGVQTPEYAATMLSWARDTRTDLRGFYGLTDDEFAEAAARAEAHLPGVTKDGGPTLRPTCDAETCGRELVARMPYTPEQAWCGMWWEHPPGPPGDTGFGHTSSTIYPAPHEQAALFAQKAVKA